jgi:XTP/dITP diphosphohydrolase
LKIEKSNKNNLKLEGKFVFFATHNIHKFNEARTVLAEFNINVGMLRIKTSELQSDSLKEIAQKSAFEIFNLYRLPILVEDSGLFVEALNGFPGPYAAYVYKTIGNGGLITLMEKTENRKAVFKSAIAYCNNDKTEPNFFEGKVVGKIAIKEVRVHSAHSFGFDPVFHPESNPKLFAEMSIAEKNLLSHRAIAFRKFARWYIKYKK